MKKIPLLQQKVNKIVLGSGSGRSVSTSFIPMVDLGISEDEASPRLSLSEFHDDFRSRVSSVLRNIGMDAQADNFDRCGEHVYNMECAHCGYVHAVRYHCKLRVCPECGWVRKGELTGFYDSALLSLAEKRRCRLRFLTLTLKNVAVLDEGVTRIRACFRKLRHRKYYKSLITGGLYGIESPVGQDGLWNIHLHCLYVGSWINRRKLCKDWLKITGDSWYVYIQAVYYGSPVGYILKYVNKYDSLVLSSDDKLGEFLSVLYNVRLLQPFGCLLGMKADKPLFLCPECGGCVWKIVDLDDGSLVGLAGVVQTRAPLRAKYKRSETHAEYLGTMYKNEV